MKRWKLHDGPTFGETTYDRCEGMNIQRKHYKEFERRQLAASVVLGVLHRHFQFSSVLDVGCSVGAWLVAARELGASRLCGVDGPWTDPTLLGIDPADFLAHDLNQPLDLNQRFDLVISIEVGEHLNTDSSRTFVDSITRHGDFVLFSAALPGQGGSGHINEQWPEFWVEMFRDGGFEAYDLIRPSTWGDTRVFAWIQQNCLLFVRNGERIPRSLESYRVEGNVPTMVHRVTYTSLLRKLQSSSK